MPGERFVHGLPFGVGGRTFIPVARSRVISAGPAAFVLAEPAGFLIEEGGRLFVAVLDKTISPEDLAGSLGQIP
jgi:hypothetical protein